MNLPWKRSHRQHRGKSGLQLKRELAAAERRILSLTAGIDQISAERNAAEKRADQAQINLGTALEEIRQLEDVVRLRDQEIKRLNERITVGVNAEHVIAKTQEIDVSELRRRFDTGSPVRLGASPVATTNPGRVPPSWARKANQPAA